MFYFRVNKLKIKDNREAPRFLLFGPDRAQVKLFSFITTDDISLPDMDEFLSSNDDVRKREIAKNAVMKVVNARIFTTIENVKDNSVMTFGDTGYVLYKSKKIPDDFSWSFLAIESDKNERAFGKRMKEVVDDEGFDSFAAHLPVLLGTAANPSFAAGVAITKFISKVVAQNLKENKDDLIGILYMSLNRREHYLHGERKSDDVVDLTNNMQIDYSIFSYEE